MLILCYHGIAMEDECEWNDAFFISKELFVSRMKTIAAGGLCVQPLDTALKALYAGDLKEPTVAITFDDGYVNFAQRALPVLRQQGFPATLYFSSYYAERQLPVFDLSVAYMLWKSGLKEIDLDAVAPGLGVQPVGTGRTMEVASRKLMAWAKDRGLDSTEKDSLARKLADRIRFDYDDLDRRRLFHLMNESEVKDAISGGIDIQLHTHRHRTPKNEGLFLREVSDNRAWIQSATGTQRLQHFCYPNGIYANDFLPWLKSADVRYATTCEPGLASAASTPLLLPRVLDSTSISGVEFEAWLSGLPELLRKVGKRA